MVQGADITKLFDVIFGHQKHHILLATKLVNVVIPTLSCERT